MMSRVCISSKAGELTASTTHLLRRGELTSAAVHRTNHLYSAHARYYIVPDRLRSKAPGSLNLLQNQGIRHRESDQPQNS
jgi:hypothetical protein